MTDNGVIPRPLSSTAKYTIDIKNMNDSTPKFENYVVNLVYDEAQPLGNLHQLTATDKDNGVNGVVMYTITSGNEDGKFALDMVGETIATPFYHTFLVHLVVLAPKRMLYRCYKKFHVEIFLNEFTASVQMLPTGNFEMFLKILTEVLDKHAPLKTKFLTGNKKPHMNKSLRKAIMLRSKLKNKALKTGIRSDMNAFRKQRNVVVNLNKKAKKAPFERTDYTSSNGNNIIFGRFVNRS